MIVFGGFLTLGLIILCFLLLIIMPVLLMDGDWPRFILVLIFFLWGLWALRLLYQVSKTVIKEVGTRLLALMRQCLQFGQRTKTKRFDAAEKMNQQRQTVSCKNFDEPNTAQIPMTETLISPRNFGHCSPKVKQAVLEIESLSKENEDDRIQSKLNDYYLPEIQKLLIAIEEHQKDKDIVRTCEETILHFASCLREKQSNKEHVQTYYDVKATCKTLDAMMHLDGLVTDDIQKYLNK